MACRQHPSSPRACHRLHRRKPSRNRRLGRCSLTEHPLSRLPSAAEARHCPPCAWSGRPRTKERPSGRFVAHHPLATEYAKSYCRPGLTRPLSDHIVPELASSTRFGGLRVSRIGRLADEPKLSCVARKALLRISVRLRRLLSAPSVVFVKLSVAVARTWRRFCAHSNKPLRGVRGIQSRAIRLIPSRMTWTAHGQRKAGVLQAVRRSIDFESNQLLLSKSQIEVTCSAEPSRSQPSVGWILVVAARRNDDKPQSTPRQQSYHPEFSN